MAPAYIRRVLLLSRKKNKKNKNKSYYYYNDNFKNNKFKNPYVSSKDIKPRAYSIFGSLYFNPSDD